MSIIDTYLLDTSNFGTSWSKRFCSIGSRYNFFKDCLKRHLVFLILLNQAVSMYVFTRVVLACNAIKKFHTENEFTNVQVNNLFPVFTTLV